MQINFYKTIFNSTIDSIVKKGEFKFEMFFDYIYGMYAL